MMLDRRTAHRDRWWLVVAAGAGLFMGQLDATVVNVALPTLEAEFAISTEVTQWAVLAFVLPLIGLALPAGRWVDSVGLRGALGLSVLGFAFASLLVGLSPGIGWLIAARVLQGTFGAVMFTLVPVLATVAVSSGAKGRAMAVVMTLGPLGAVSGPVVGGVAIDTIGWRWVFLLNVPVSLAIAAIGWTQLGPGARLRWPDRAGLAQLALLSGAAASVLIGLTFGVRQPAWLLLVLLVVPLTVFWLRLDASRPVVDLLSVRGLRATHGAITFEMAAVAGVQFLIPFHLVRELGTSPSEVGLIMLTTPVVMILAGGAAGAAVDRGEARRVARFGAATVLLATAVTVVCVAYGGALAVAGALALLGLGAAFFAGPSQAAAMSAADAGHLGTTAATTSLARQLGVAAGPALATAVWTATGGGSTGLLVAMAMAAPVCLVSVVVLGGGPRSILAPNEGVSVRRVR